MKICLVCSQGGHLTELMELMDAFKGHDAFLITHDEKFTRSIEDVYSIKTYLIKDFLVKSLSFKALRILGNMAVISLSEIRIFLFERPDVVVSTGSEIAIPMAYLAKAFGKRVVFIESLCRVSELSFTGRAIYPIADIFLVQWKHLVDKYDRSRYEGRVL
jgi:beta-1,4-N-acetylglucosaminyltransferase